MKTSQILTLTIVFCAVAITPFAIGLSLSHNDMQSKHITNSKSEKFTKQAIVTRLTSKNQKEREKATETIRNERAELIRDLIGLAGQEVERWHPDDLTSSYPWHDSKHLAILLLGDLRAFEALPVLIENLGYRNPRQRVIDARIVEEGWYYPAAEALSKIGMPAVGSIIDNLGVSAQKSKSSELCCWVLKKILGVRLSRVRLQIAIEETRDEAVKNKLTEALLYFKTEQEKAAEERARRGKNSG